MIYCPFVYFCSIKEELCDNYAKFYGRIKTPLLAIFDALKTIVKLNKLSMRKILLMMTAVLCAGLAYAQDITVTGTVTDAENGEPMMQVSVAILGTANGTTTNLDGTYSIRVASDAELSFSFMGYETTTVPVNGQRTINVSLEPESKMVDEIVVQAYGTATRAQFVGSSSAVTGDKISAKSVSNVTNALSGVASGVQVVNGSGQPGSGATIRIRGVGSINGGTTPLYIIDGTPAESGTINLLNSHDIESMTVLKDAAATAIYGARGANGVIMITTKSGSKANKGVINFEAKVGNSSRGVPNYDVMTDPMMYYETAYKALYNSQIAAGVSSTGAYAYADANLFTQTGVGYQIYTVPDGELFIGRNFKVNPHATLGYSDGKYYYINDNWEKESIKSSNLRKEYNLSMNGGDDKVQYFISGGYLDDPGIVNGSGFERFTLRSKVDAQVKKWLKAGVSMAYANANYQNPGYQTSWGSTGNIFYTANSIAPIYPFYVRNADGSIKVDERGYTVYDTGLNTQSVRPGSAPQGNHAINLLIDENNSFRDDINANAYLTFNPFRGFYFTARVAPEVYNSRYNELNNPFYNAKTEEGTVGVEHTRMIAVNQQYIANYKVNFNEDNKLELLAGFESYSQKTQTLTGQNDHLFSPYVGELDNAYGVNPASSSVGSNTDSYATQGFMGRLQYDLMNRYFFNATVRHEASSIFSPEKRWGTFGSVGAAWLLSEEGFIEDLDIFDELKLKASYGTQGNDQVGTNYAYLDRYTISYNSDTKEYSKTLSVKGNPDLTWEAQKLFNIGLDFSMFKNKLYGNIEYFSRVNSDMLYNVPMPPSAGYSSQRQNIGSVANRGVELELGYNIIYTKNVRWNIDGNITHIKSEILEMPEYTKANGGIKQTASILKEGGSLNQAYMVKWAGVDPTTGEGLYYVDPDNGDFSTTNDYTAAKQADLGDISAKFYGGFSTTVEAYGFDFTAQFSYQLGGQAYDGGYQGLMHAGAQLGFNWHKDILNAWTPENTNTDVPRLCTTDNFNQNVTSRWLVSSNYLSLNNITLGYTIPAKLTRKAQISKARVYVSGDNLALLSARKGFDPRQSQNSWGTGVGYQTTSGNYVYSQLKVLSAGLSLTF